ncbi:MAG: hypothetical protein HYV29_03280 [Ignavibacteriales bacterium]|nr:hypothetical protein [Ignavibacteriales bacterium]
MNNTKQVLPISDRSQTHKFIPKAIIEWAKLPKSESLFKQLVYNNFSFSRWFDASPYRVMAVSQRIATSWFDEYSLDLNYIERDHILRNEMSYRPQGFAIDFNNNAFQTTLSFVKDLWKISEPDSSNAFSILDRHLLRLGIEKLYHSQTTPLRKLDSSVYTKFVMDIFDNLGISTSNHLFQFIIRRVEPNDLDLFSYAKQGPYRKRINSNNNPSYYRKNQYYSLNDVFGILSRTFILMRFSLSMANGLLNNSTITKNDIGFWLNNLGRNFGISNNLSNTTNLTDLYTSVKDSMESIETIDTIVASPTLLDAHNNSVSDEFKFLIQFQRAFFWGITN